MARDGADETESVTAELSVSKWRALAYEGALCFDGCEGMNCFASAGGNAKVAARENPPSIRRGKTGKTQNRNGQHMGRNAKNAAGKTKQRRKRLGRMRAGSGEVVGGKWERRRQEADKMPPETGQARAGTRRGAGEKREKRRRETKQVLAETQRMPLENETA